MILPSRTELAAMVRVALPIVTAQVGLMAMGVVDTLMVGRVSAAVIVVANIINAFLNWVFVYGNIGSPAMGAAGSAWATAVSRWLMAALMLGFGWPTLRRALLPWRRESFHIAPLASMLRLGIPIGLMQGLELGAFAAIGVLMGVLGTREMAAHQIAINLASLTFMVPLGVGAAA